MPTVASFDVRIGAKIDDFKRGIRQLQSEIRSLRDRVDRDFVRSSRDSLQKLDKDLDRIGRTVRKIKVDFDKSFSRETFKIKVKAELDKNSLAAIRRQLSQAVAAPLGLPSVPAGGGGGRDTKAGMSLRTKLIIGAIAGAGYGTYALAKNVIPPIVKFGGPATAAIYSAPVLHQVHTAALLEASARNTRSYQLLNRDLARGTIYTTKDVAALIRALAEVGIESPDAIRKHARRVIENAESNDMSLEDAAQAYADLVEKYGARRAYKIFGEDLNPRTQDTLYGDYRRLIAEGTRYLDALVMANEPWMRAFMRNLNARMSHVNELFDLKLMDPRTANTLEGQALRDWRTVRGESWLMTTLRGLLGTPNDPLARKNPLIRFLEAKPEERMKMITDNLNKALEQIDYSKVAEGIAKGIEDVDWRSIGRNMPWEEIIQAWLEGMPRMIQGVLEGAYKGGSNLALGILERMGIDPRKHPILSSAAGVLGGLAGGYLGYRMIRPLVHGVPLIGNIAKKIEETIGKQLGNIWEKFRGPKGPSGGGGSRSITVRVLTKGLDALKKLKDALKNLKNKTVTAKAKTSGTGAVSSLRKALQQLKSKNVTARVRSIGKAAVDALRKAVQALRGKNVTARARAFGKSAVDALRNAIRRLFSKSVKASAKTSGKSGVDALYNSIRRLFSKTVRAVAKTSGKGAVDALRSAIGKLYGKRVTVSAEVSGLGAVRELVKWIGRLRGKKHGGGTITKGIRLPGWLAKGARLAEWIQPYNPSYQKGEPLGTEFDRWLDAKIQDLIRHGGGTIPKAHGGMAFRALTVAGAGTVPVNLWGGEMILTQQQQSWLFNLLRYRRDVSESGNAAMQQAINTLVRVVSERLSRDRNTVINVYNNGRNLTGRDVTDALRRKEWLDA